MRSARVCVKHYLAVGKAQFHAAANGKIETKTEFESLKRQETRFSPFVHTLIYTQALPRRAKSNRSFIHASFITFLIVQFGEFKRFVTCKRRMAKRSSDKRIDKAEWTNRIDSQVRNSTRSASTQLIRLMLESRSGCVVCFGRKPPM